MRFPRESSRPPPRSCDDSDGGGRTLKVLFASDLSKTALVARGLLASLTWPRGAELEVLHVVQQNAHAAAKKEAMAFARELQAQLVGRSVSVCSSMRVGDPSTRIIARADEIGADLVVVGSRGRGPLVSSLLGTVSAAVVDRARCAVLVARTESIRGLALVDDGTTNTHAAVEAIARGSLFDAVHVTVVRVVDLQTPLGQGLFQVREAYEQRDRVLASRTKQAAAVVDKRVAGLRALGRMAMGRVLTGETATELLSAARGVGADLMVIGAESNKPPGEGHLGAVARSVLLGFRGSVLIARSGR
jgi:nucleotide-binding universal stress UspA family protein